MRQECGKFEQNKSAAKESQGQSTASSMTYIFI